MCLFMSFAPIYCGIIKQLINKLVVGHFVADLLLCLIVADLLLCLIVADLLLCLIVMYILLVYLSEYQTTLPWCIVVTSSITYFFG